MAMISAMLGGFIAIPTVVAEEEATTTQTEDIPTNELTSDEAIAVREDFKNLRNIKCIDDKDDTKYIVTFIEEPLSLKEKKTDDFEQRICYRHFFQYKLNNKWQNESELSRAMCDNDSYLAYLAEEVPSATYSCKPILVLLSKGGTTLLYNYIGMLYRWGVSMAGIIAVLVMVISGIQISVAGGESEAVTNAKKRIFKSLAGIAVLILSGVILYTINPDFFVR